MAAATARIPAPAPREWALDVAAALVGLGFGAVIALGITAETSGTLAAPGGVLTFVGRLAALAGTYLLLVMVLLIGRVPIIERVAGQDRLVGWHRRVSPWAVGLIVLHVVAITLGYAELARAGVLAQLWTFITTYPDVLAAVVGFALLLMASATSIRAARQRVRYETWWAVHLYTYLALALAFAHQIVTGASFVDHPVNRLVWILAWAATAGLVLVCRVVIPVGRSIRYRLRIAEVRVEAPGVVSLICSGRHLEELAVSGGQWFQWRFLTPGLWWQAHPYSLSAMPQPPYLRVTVKDLGDGSQHLGRLHAGTRIAIEGPYGTFTPQVAAGAKTLLIGAGVGVTPLRALLEDFPPGTDVEVILRGSIEEDLVFRGEIAALVARTHGRLHELVGPRAAVRLDTRALARLVPDIRERDVYVCGPDRFTSDLVRSARRLGVPAARLHYESFSL